MMIKEYKKLEKTAANDKIVGSAVYYINKREKLGIDLSQICKELKLKKKGFMKFYGKFVNLLKLPSIETEYIKEAEETKKSTNKIMTETKTGLFKSGDVGVLDIKCQDYTDLLNLSNYLSSSEMAVVASSVPEQVEKWKTDALNHFTKTYAHLLLNYLLEPLTSLDSLSKLTPINLAIELKDRISTCLKYVAIKVKNMTPEELTLKLSNELAIEFCINKTNWTNKTQKLIDYQISIINELVAWIEGVKVQINEM